MTFQYNGTGFSSLSITSAVPKTYNSTTPPPTWAVETLPSPLTISDTQPLWGLFPSNSSLPNTNISTLPAASLRLPGLVSSLTAVSRSLDYVPSIAGQNIPGVDFYVQALQNAFTIASPGTVGYEGYADYSGLTSGLALYGKWQGLSKTPEGAAQILRLVWTDVAANSVVGTKGWGDGDRVEVVAWGRRVRYHMGYIVPAVVVLGLAGGVVGVWVALVVMGRTGRGKMRRLLEVTSAGRIWGGVLWPGEGGRTGTGQWVKTVGTRVVVVGAGEGGVVTAREKGQEEGVMEGEEGVQLMARENKQGHVVSFDGQ